jgi:ketosteroid isomerase-like protein
MSQENVELIRKIVATQFEFGSAFVGVEGRSYRGPESGGQYFADLADAFDSFELDIEDSLDVGDGPVLTTIRVLGRGKASGADFDTHIWSVNGVRDGKIVSGQTYLQQGEALEAVGLRK